MSQSYFLPHDPQYSRNVAKHRAWRDYHIAVAEKGPDDPATIALWGRVQAFEKDAAADELPDVALIAFYRANGEHSGIRNRTARAHPCVTEIVTHVV